MSYRVTTKTPILDLECLICALRENQLSFTQQSDLIIKVSLHNHSYSNITYTKQPNDCYLVEYYKDHSEERELVEKLEKSYIRIYQEKLEKLEQQRQEEEARLQRERLERYKEEQKQRLIQKAKQQGYTVKEVKRDNKIQLVCVRYT